MRFCVRHAIYGLRRSGWIGYIAVRWPSAKRRKLCPTLNKYFLSYFPSFSAESRAPPRHQTSASVHQKFLEMPRQSKYVLFGEWVARVYYWYLPASHVSLMCCFAFFIFFRPWKSRNFHFPMQSTTSRPLRRLGTLRRNSPTTEGSGKPHVRRSGGPIHLLEIQDDLNDPV